MKNKYIAFEGIDGSGKTLQSERLVAYLHKLGQYVIWTREPGSPHINLNVREFLLSDKKINSKTLELLFQADRAEHTAWVEQQIKDGYWIISDRCYVSGLAYAMSYGHDYEKLAKILEFSIQWTPDLVILMDVTAKTSMARVAAKGSNTREEARGEVVRDTIRSNYIWLAQRLQLSQQFFVVDSENTSPDDSFGRICQVLGI